ncbi:universal stress protein [Caldimonas caldifontis]|uniref:Universal stress protein UspA n=1 Tax=Caldimonas caldifontis TaxID=1452508 RepID=A0A2S5SWS2_9BURK|nr:universal stress protein [Caldimonas caldifontis]PPE67213.1 universal stress protein UspA [Caldimonas caldifontis]
MDKVYACIDGRSNSDAVIDWGIWSAQRLQGQLEFLHVLERPDAGAEVKDYSGAIGLGAQESLLQDLSERDARHGRAAREAGRALVAAARARAEAAGVTRHDSRLRHGDFVETVIEMQGDAGLFVLGEHHHATAPGRVHREHHVERVIRGVSAPVLVATTERFEVPQRVVLAFDGGAASRRSVGRVAHHPLLRGLPVLVAQVGEDTALARRQLDEASRALLDSGVRAESELVPGEPQAVLPPLVKAQGPALLVMGAFGHSRLRRLVLGSTTSTLLRVSEVPVLVLR